MAESAQCQFPPPSFSEKATAGFPKIQEAGRLLGKCGQHYSNSITTASVRGCSYSEGWQRRRKDSDFLFLLYEEKQRETTQGLGIRAFISSNLILLFYICVHSWDNPRRVGVLLEQFSPSIGAVSHYSMPSCQEQSVTLWSSFWQ